ncbi:uncharacterized protein LOC112347036 [Selaginella moellendorffii]|uniref:uncharacterized protein LOC112347036 n=1 Tax=Selaginella moellendorffii TaxID=88036 RepID=UPI000D1D0367|nr:uncharacterized protein LOC112347036 [Selaginella moellendorffii]|eukprot:XP_024532926.1 uncharacterized protein LOC112347036 [Selaginella moellendorffii]
MARGGSWYLLCPSRSPTLATGFGQWLLLGISRSALLLVGLYFVVAENDFLDAVVPNPLTLLEQAAESSRDSGGLEGGGGSGTRWRFPRRQLGGVRTTEGRCPGLRFEDGMPTLSLFLSRESRTSWPG